MGYIEESEYEYVYLNSDGEYVCGFKAEWDATCFRDYGTYLIPAELFD